MSGGSPHLTFEPLDQIQGLRRRRSFKARKKDHAEVIYHSPLFLINKLCQEINFPGWWGEGLGGSWVS